MWTPFLVASLLLGLAALVWSLAVDLSGWAELPALASFFIWLAFLSVTLLGVLWGLWTSLRWTGVSSIIIFCATVQWGLFLGQRGRLVLAFMPTMLLVIAGIALSARTLPDWILRILPCLALAGIIFFAGVGDVRMQERTGLKKRLQAVKEQHALNDRTLRGHERAAWLLGQEFSIQDDYRRPEFLASGIYRNSLSGGEYRWDATRKRLIVARPLAVGPDTRVDDGTLNCTDRGCIITWEIDVDQLHDGDRALRKRIDARVAELQFGKARNR